MSKIAIIGGGPIGIYLCTLLLDLNHEIHLFESGNYQSDSKFLNQDSYDFLKPTKMPAQVHRLYGGTNYWKSRIGEFLDIDFKSNNSGRWNGWPIAKKELDEGYESALEFLNHDIRRDSQLESEFKNKIRHFVENPELSIRIHKFARTDIWKKSLEKLLSNQRFSLRFNTFCNKIIPETEISKTSLALLAGGRQIVEEFDIVVLAAGTYGSTALLLRSKELDIPNNGILGSGLMEHIEGVVGHIAVYSKRKKEFFRKVLLNEDFCFENKNYGGGLYLTDSKITYHLEVLPLQDNFVPLKSPMFIMKYWKAWRRTRIFLEKLLFNGEHYSLNLKAEEFSFKYSKLYLDEGREKLVVDHKITKTTLQAIQSELVRFKNYFEYKNLCKCFLDKRVLNYLSKSGLSPNWHPMGTTRLGVSEDSSVVNPNLSLHRHTNIYVASASVFPTGSNGHPTFTTMALAYRLSKHISRSNS